MGGVKSGNLLGSVLDQSSSGSVTQLAPDWIHVDHASYVSTAADDNQITLNTNLLETIWVGMPMRVQCPEGVEFGDIGGQVSGYNSITGLDVTNLSVRGRLYVDIVADGGGFYHIDLQKAPLTTPRTFFNLVAHTNSYNQIGGKVLFPDNNSGVGGGLVVERVANAADFFVEFWTWHVVSEITSTRVKLYGPPISTVAGGLKNLWYGKPTRVQQNRVQMDGSLWTKEELYQLDDWWNGPPGRLVHLSSSMKVEGGGLCTINLNSAIVTPISPGDATDHDLAPLFVLAEQKTPLLVEIVGGGPDEAQWNGLVIKTTWVLE